MRTKTGATTWQSRPTLLAQQTTTIGATTSRAAGRSGATKDTAEIASEVAGQLAGERLVSTRLASLAAVQATDELFKLGHAASRHVCALLRGERQTEKAEGQTVCGEATLFSWSARHYRKLEQASVLYSRSRPRRERGEAALTSSKAKGSKQSSDLDELHGVIIVLRRWACCVLTYWAFFKGCWLHPCFLLHPAAP